MNIVNNRAFICLVTLLSLITTRLDAQYALEGKVINHSTKAGISSAEVIIEYGKPPHIQKKRGFADGDGNFSIGIDSKPTMFVDIRVYSRGYSDYKEEGFLIEPESKPLLIRLYDEMKAVKNEVEKVVMTSVEELNIEVDKKKVLVSQSEDANMIEKEDVLSRLSEKQQEVGFLRDSIYTLLDNITGHKIDKQLAEQKIAGFKRSIQNLHREIDNLMTRIGRMEEDIYRAYMNVVNCYCEAYSPNSLTMSFELVDRDGHELTPSVETFVYEVYRLESVNSIGKDSKRPLIYQGTGQSYMKEELVLPASKVNFTFITQDREFKSASNNYYVKIYNEKFNKALKEVEITSLNADCKKEQDYVPESKVNGRDFQILKEVKLSTPSAKLIVSDPKNIDGDIVSIMLNGKWLLEYHEITDIPQALDVEFDQEENYLIFQAENLGKVSPNTALLQIRSGERLIDVNVSTKMDMSQGVRIIVNKEY